MAAGVVEKASKARILFKSSIEFKNRIEINSPSMLRRVLNIAIPYWNVWLTINLWPLRLALLKRKILLS